MKLLAFAQGVLAQTTNRNFWILLSGDTILLFFAHLFAYLLRFEGMLSLSEFQLMAAAFPLIVLIKLPVFYLFGLYRGMWRFTSLVDMQNILKATLASSLALIVIIVYLNRFAGFSRSVFILDALFTFVLISGLRLAIRFWYNHQKTPRDITNSPSIQKKRLLLLGAGEAAEKIIREIKENQQLPFMITGLLDDDTKKIGKHIHGVPIYGPIADLPHYITTFNADEILISIATATGSQMKTIIEICKNSELPYKTIPGLSKIIDGKVSIKNIRDVSYEDILGRDEAKLDKEEIKSYITNKIILVTGGGGSIGSELCRQLIKYNPEKLIIIDSGEENLYDIQMELLYELQFTPVTPILGQVQDVSLVDRTLQQYKPHVIFHAAAYKHVPLIELNPWEAVTNNIFGTQCLIEAAIIHRVERFVLVSTDKAVRPTSVMGASKRIAELLLQAYSYSIWDRVLHIYPRAPGKSPIEHETLFTAVRFGNVLGSAGSVIPLFKRQIEAGGPVTVTHPEITRYFMLVGEAAQLILQAASMTQGSDIFILNMGKPIRIVNMAEDLIRMVGKEPYKDIAIQFIGLRPGEKLYEELITEGEGIIPTKHDSIMVLKGNGQIKSDFFNNLQILYNHAEKKETEKIIREINNIISKGYQ